MPVGLQKELLSSHLIPTHRAAGGGRGVVEHDGVAGRAALDREGLRLNGDPGTPRRAARPAPPRTCGRKRTFRLWVPGWSGSSGAIYPRRRHAQKAKMSPFLVGGPLINGAAGGGPTRSAPRPSASRFPQDIANVRRRACHHCGSELASFARARIDESFLSFAHKGIDGAGCTVIPGGIAITPVD